MSRRSNLLRRCLNTTMSPRSNLLRRFLNTTMSRRSSLLRRCLNTTMCRRSNLLLRFLNATMSRRSNLLRRFLNTTMSRRSSLLRRYLNTTRCHRSNLLQRPNQDHHLYIQHVLKILMCRLQSILIRPRPNQDHHLYIQCVLKILMCRLQSILICPRPNQDHHLYIQCVFKILMCRLQSIIIRPRPNQDHHLYIQCVLKILMCRLQSIIIRPRPNQDHHLYIQCVLKILMCRLQSIIIRPRPNQDHHLYIQCVLKILMCRLQSIIIRPRPNQDHHLYIQCVLKILMCRLQSIIIRPRPNQDHHLYIQCVLKILMCRLQSILIRPRPNQDHQEPHEPQPQKPHQPTSPQELTIRHQPKQPSFQSCEVEQNVRVPCGAPDISAAACEAISCCFDGRQCYFGKAVTVQCTKDAQFIVVVARDATLPHIDLSSISLLGEACGSVVMEEPGVIIYENRMSSSFEVGVGDLGVITRDSYYDLLFQCRYIGSSVETVVTEVLPLQEPPLGVAAWGPIEVQLRLANGQCHTKGCNELDVAYTSFYTEADYPVTKVLRDPVYVEVQLMGKTDPHLVLTLGRCWTTTSSNPHSLPQWDILIDGCPYRDDRYMSSLVPVGSSSGLDFPSHYRRFLFKMFTFVDSSSMVPLREQ
ncbi:hypothetical protein INR49_021565, partial [Caranx melampygus]